MNMIIKKSIFFGLLLNVNFCILCMQLPLAENAIPANLNIDFFLNQSIDLYNTKYPNSDESIAFTSVIPPKSAGPLDFQHITITYKDIQHAIEQETTGSKKQYLKIFFVACIFFNELKESEQVFTDSIIQTMKGANETSLQFYTRIQHYWHKMDNLLFKECSNNGFSVFFGKQLIPIYSQSIQHLIACNIILIMRHRIDAIQREEEVRCQRQPSEKNLLQKVFWEKCFCFVAGNMFCLLIEYLIMWYRK